MAAVPRRLSVKDADYDPDIGARLVVLLDGVDQYGLAEAYDIDAGIVTRAKPNAHGRVCLEDGFVRIEKVRGKVEARWKVSSLDAEA